jgi:hypothetical protein
VPCEKSNPPHGNLATRLITNLQTIGAERMKLSARFRSHQGTVVCTVRAPSQSFVGSSKMPMVAGLITDNIIKVDKTNDTFVKINMNFEE